MKKTKEPQVGMLPTRVISPKLGAPAQDFTGQKPRNAGSGKGHPEVRPASANVPGERHTRPVRVFRSDDDRLHVSRSEQLQDPSRVHDAPAQRGAK